MLHSSFHCIPGWIIIIHQPAVGDLGMVAAVLASGNQTRPGKISGVGWFSHPNLHDSRGGSTNGGIQNGWFRKWKIPSRNGWWLGAPLFQETTISCWWSQLVSQWYPNIPGNHPYPCTYPSIIPTMFPIHLNDPRNPHFPSAPHSAKAKTALQSKVSPTSLATRAAVWPWRPRGFWGYFDLLSWWVNTTSMLTSYEKPTMKVDRFRTWFFFPQDLTHWKWGFDEHQWKRWPPLVIQTSAPKRDILIKDFPAPSVGLPDSKGDSVWISGPPIIQKKIHTTIILHGLSYLPETLKWFGGFSFWEILNLSKQECHENSPSNSPLPFQQSLPGVAATTLAVSSSLPPGWHGVQLRGWSVQPALPCQG